MKKLKKFEKLCKLVFSDNNIHSFIQISKLEQIPTLKSIEIKNNDVSWCVLCRSYIVYWFPNVEKIDGKRVMAPENEKAKLIFQNFDKILSNDRGQ